MLSCAQRISAVAQSPSSFARVRVRLLLMDAVLLLLEQLPIEQQTRTAPAPDRYQQLHPAIELALSANALVSNDDAASACALSVSQFNRQFHALMGISFAQFALRHRLHGAAEEIAATSHPIKTIAQHWGFTDASHLHRLFAQHYEFTPAQYRAVRGMS